MTLSPVPGLRLTGLASCAGCAAKMGIGTLHDVLAPLKGIFDQMTSMQKRVDRLSRKISGLGRKLLKGIK